MMAAPLSTFDIAGRAMAAQLAAIQKLRKR